MAGTFEAIYALAGTFSDCGGLAINAPISDKMQNNIIKAIEKILRKWKNIISQFDIYRNIYSQNVT